MLSPCFSLPVGALCLTLHACLFAFLFQRPVSVLQSIHPTFHLHYDVWKAQLKHYRPRNFEINPFNMPCVSVRLSLLFWITTTEIGKPLRSGSCCQTFPKDTPLFCVTQEKQTVKQSNRKICQYNDFFLVSVLLNNWKKENFWVKQSQESRKITEGHSNLVKTKLGAT